MKHAADNNHSGKQGYSKTKPKHFRTENQNAAPENVEKAEEASISYIGNKNSKNFHAPDCKNLPKESNRVYFNSYDAAIDAGFAPCGSCLG